MYIHLFSLITSDSCRVKVIDTINEIEATYMHRTMNYEPDFWQAKASVYVPALSHDYIIPLIPWYFIAKYQKSETMFNRVKTSFPSIVVTSEILVEKLRDLNK